MGLDKIGKSEVSPCVINAPVQKRKGRFQGRSVTIDRGKKFIQWCFSLIGNLIPGFSLLKRSIKLAFSKKRQSMKGKYWEEVSLPDNLQALREIAVDSALVQLPYTLNLDNTDGWDTVRSAENFQAEWPGKDDLTQPCRQDKPFHQLENRLFEQLISQGEDQNNLDQQDCLLTNEQKELAQDELFKNVTLLPSGMLIDAESGLTAVMVIDQTSKKLTLAFGGTFSGKGAGGLFDHKGKKSFKRRGRTWAQLKADIRNITGWSIPKCYRQAAKLTELIKSMVSSAPLLDALGLKDSQDMLFLSGHSLGGGMVQYASAKAKVSGRAFSSAALGKKVLKDLTEGEKRLASGGLVSNYLIGNDLANTPLGYRLWHKQFTPTVIGKRTIIKGEGKTGKNTLYGRHSWSHMHYMEALQKKREALMQQPPPSYEEVIAASAQKKPPVQGPAGGG